MAPVKFIFLSIPSRYGDKVGYAPSVYLLPYNNPHLRKLTVVHRQRTNSEKIIPRR